MPITRSAKKALRQSDRKKLVNDRRKKAMKETIKKVSKLVKEKKNDDAKALLSQAYAAIDKAAKRGVIKKNNASRKKALLSRMTKAK